MSDSIERYRRRRAERIMHRMDDEWITINGTHVMVDDDGAVKKGPSILKKESSKATAKSKKNTPTSSNVLLDRKTKQNLMEDLPRARDMWYSSEQTGDYREQEEQASRARKAFKRNMDKVPDGAEFKLVFTHHHPNVNGDELAYYKFTKQGNGFVGEYIDPKFDWRNKKKLSYSLDELLSVYCNEPNHEFQFD